jgi:UDP-glucose 4-epimerase
MNPYGQSKLQTEEILRDLAISDKDWKIISLRYFNPVGAHESGLIGEDPNGIPNNLMPYIAKVASGELPHVNVFGDNYETRDGTGERDYIHVMDLAEGHKAALLHLENSSRGFEVINLGTGKSVSVLKLISVYEKVIGRKIKKVISKKRPGDLPVYYAQASKAKKLLNWKAMRSVRNMCETTLEFNKCKISK